MKLVAITNCSYVTCFLTIKILITTINLPRYINPNPPLPTGFPTIHCFFLKSVNVVPSGSGAANWWPPFGARGFLAKNRITVK